MNEEQREAVLTARLTLSMNARTICAFTRLIERAIADGNNKRAAELLAEIRDCTNDMTRASRLLHMSEVVQ